MRLVHSGEELTAPGTSRNPVPVEALYDRQAAHEVTLRNLLQRQGYRDLEEVRGEGREEGLAEGLRRTVRALCRAFDIELDAERQASLAAMGVAELEATEERLLRDRTWN